MKVYLELPTQSRGIGRVYDALIKFAPKKIEITKNMEECDLAVFHVIGRRDKIQEGIELLAERGKEYAMIQYVIRSSQKPSTLDWIPMWQNAKLVWSYYDLYALCKEDSPSQFDRFNFYYAPLGVDSEVFKDYHYLRDFTILASGQHALSESVRECAFATKRVQGKMIHLGHELRRGGDIQCVSGISDQMLAELYSQCRFVSGLRRIEGFELEVLEGLMCGARPIVFDRPHYRKWYNDFAIFIPEGDRGETIVSLENIFRNESEPVTNEQKEKAKKIFDWQTIIEGFWQEILL